MAHADLHVAHSADHSLVSLLTAPFRAVFDALIHLSENTSQAKAIAHLQELSDEDFERLGTTRVDEVRRVFASCGAI